MRVFLLETIEVTEAFEMTIALHEMKI